MRYLETVCVAAVMAALGAGAAAAQSVSQPAIENQETETTLDEIVVTAVAGSSTTLRSSVSVTTLGAETIEDLAPRSTAEIFRSIPGIRSESSGGEGNANIAVRGLPISSGGAKFLQLQEDGLPVLEFGDIAFANADIFTRYDGSVARIQAVRGGSASTFASNSPGGVINFISKTGTQTGGNLAYTRGLDYDTDRLDADYGHNFENGWSAHVGGFYRVGEGTREAGYDAEKGGQIRANVTRDFGNGYIRANFKYLNDKAISYLPMPLQATGTNGDPDYGSIPGFDISRDVPNSPFTTGIASLSTDNRRVEDDLRNGMNPEVKQFGLEGRYDFANGWSIENRFKYADVGGEFIGLFPSSVIGAQSATDQVGAYLTTGNLTGVVPAGTAFSLRYATGPNAGQTVTDPATLNGNGLLMQTNVFNTKLDTLDNWMNNLKISRTFDVGGGTIDFSGGYYRSTQDVGTTWTWSSYLQDVRGGGQSAFYDVFDQTGAKLTRDGQWAYGVPTFGNCCTRTSYTQTDIDAFYASAAGNFGGLNLDASVRRDEGRTEGYQIANSVASNVDVDGNGLIEPIERRVSVFDDTTRNPVDFDYGYWSYSLGMNYLINPDVAVFARYSKGARANNDRLLFDRILPDGSAREGDIVNPVRQGEVGIKYRAGDFGLYVTAFMAETSELLADDRAGEFVTNRDYESRGIEIEGSYNRGNFSLVGSATLTDAEITRDEQAPELEGNTPQRQAEFVFSLSPSYRTERFGVGLSAIGTSDSFATNTNGLIMPGYTQVNAFAEVYVTPDVTLSVNGNNIFDTFGLTEAEEGSITPGITNFVRARAINGRTVSATLRYSF